jgi:AcrR family transcriptional regulator
LTQEVLHQEPEPGLRSLKKRKTRRAIQDAALDLFAEQGFEESTVEQIAARAEVSTATFFRYFKTKAEVIFSGQAYLHPALERAIIERPRAEDDLAAIRNAMRENWLPLLDPEQTIRQARASVTSPLLRGMGTDLAFQWQDLISGALAKRRGLTAPDQQCQLTSSVVFSIFSTAINAWLRGGCPDDLATAIDSTFQLMTDLCAQWCEKPNPDRETSS